MLAVGNSARGMDTLFSLLHFPQLLEVAEFPLMLIGRKRTKLLKNVFRFLQTQS
jgi:hypothetical protein